MFSFRRLLMAPFRLLAEMYGIAYRSVLKIAEWFHVGISKTLKFIKDGFFLFHRCLTFAYSAIFRFSLFLSLLFMPAFIYFDPLGWTSFLEQKLDNYVKWIYLYYPILVIFSLVSIAVTIESYRFFFSKDDEEEDKPVSLKDFPSQLAASCTILAFAAYLLVFRMDFLIGYTFGNEMRTQIYNKVGVLLADFQDIPEPIARHRVRIFFGDVATGDVAERVKLDDYIEAWCIESKKGSSGGWTSSNGRFIVRRTYAFGFVSNGQALLWGSLRMKGQTLFAESQNLWIELSFIEKGAVLANTSWRTDYLMAKCS